MTRSVVARALLALCSWACVGCDETTDPLDPEEIAAVARGRGDAEGSALSGLYRGTFEPIECGCDELDGAEGLDSLCQAVETLSLFGTGDQLTVELVQADGSLRLRGLTGDLPTVLDTAFVTLYGSLDDDGALSVAGRIRAEDIVVIGEILGRVDGTLQLDPVTEDGVLEATYQQRYRVQLLPGVERVEARARDIDCRERLDVSLQQIGPLPQPLG